MPTLGKVGEDLRDFRGRESRRRCNRHGCERVSRYAAGPAASASASASAEAAALTAVGAAAPVVKGLVIAAGLL